MSNRKNAARLSILKLKFIKGMLLFILNETNWVLAVNNLYTMEMLNKLPAAIENIFDKKFDILGLEYVNNEEIDPATYNKRHITKLVVK